MLYERGLNPFAKKYRTMSAVQSAQADMGRNFSHDKKTKPNNVFLIMLWVIRQNGF